MKNQDSDQVENDVDQEELGGCPIQAISDWLKKFWRRLRS